MSESPHATPGIGRVVLWGTCDTGKPRVRILIDGLRAQGVEVIEVRANPWRGIKDKSQVKGIGRWLGLLASVVLAYPKLAWGYLRAPAHDWVLLGYPAMLDIFVIRLLAWVRGAPITMDWFLSAYDTIVLDRQLIGPRNPLAWLIYAVEWLAVRLADAPFMDTATHARRMEGLFGLAKGRCGHVWVGVEQAFLDMAEAHPAPPPNSDAPTRVLFYGQFIPLHGIPTIIEAARILRDEPVQWTIVGQGQEAPRIRAMLEAEPLPALRWLDWIEYAQLRREILAVHVCLGIFGTSDKAASVIPNKAFQILATGRPLVTRDSDALRELVGEGRRDIALVPAGDASALAAAVLRWRRMPPVPDPGRSELNERTTPAAIGRQLLGVLQGKRT